MTRFDADVNAPKSPSASARPQDFGDGLNRAGSYLPNMSTERVLSISSLQNRRRFANSIYRLKRTPHSVRGTPSVASGLNDGNAIMPRESFAKIQFRVRNEVRYEERRVGSCTARETPGLEHTFGCETTGPLDNRPQVFDELPGQPSFSSVQTKSVWLSAPRLRIVSTM